MGPLFITGHIKRDLLSQVMKVIVALVGPKFEQEKKFLWGQDLTVQCIPQLTN